MKYPYIGEGLNSGSVVLIYAPSKGVTIEAKTRATKNNQHEDSVDESFFKEITHDYLQSTYGEVQSLEHAEYIAELCESNGIELFNFYSDDVTHFMIKHDQVRFTRGGLRPKHSNCKLITIPLPPKEIGGEALSSDEETELKSRAMASELNSQSNNDEWPQVGDEAAHPVCGLCKVTSPADSRGVIAVLSEEGFNVIVFNSDLSKPKTPEDLLIEELQTKLLKNNAVDNWMLAANIISGDIEGLTYTLKDGK